VAAEFLTIPEVAKLLRVGERTAYGLARDGKLPAIKVGNQWRVRRTALEEWVDAGRAIAAGGPIKADEAKSE